MSLCVRLNFQKIKSLAHNRLSPIFLFVFVFSQTHDKCYSVYRILSALKIHKVEKKKYIYRRRSSAVFCKEHHLQKNNSWLNIVAHRNPNVAIGEYTAISGRGPRRRSPCTKHAGSSSI